MKIEIKKDMRFAKESNTVIFKNADKKISMNMSKMQTANGKPVCFIYTCSNCSLWLIASRRQRFKKCFGCDQGTFESTMIGLEM